MGEHAGLLEELLKQEQELQFTEFTNETAIEIGSRIIRNAAANQQAIVVDIRRNGQKLYYARMNGRTADNDLWVERKNRTVQHFGHSSYYMHVLFKEQGRSLADVYLEPKDYAAEGGAFPLIIKNVGAVGTITVSGLKGHEDHASITDVLAEWLGKAK